ncbi:hypothetical protein OV320_0184 [Actinobacteria bacterium OV320]|nr:hypothetical protein OV320_0184 [Actinobacteria bacterium OV320]
MKARSAARLGGRWQRSRSVELFGRPNAGEKHVTQLRDRCAPRRSDTAGTLRGAVSGLDDQMPSLVLGQGSVGNLLRYGNAEKSIFAAMRARFRRAGS